MMIYLPGLVGFLLVLTAEARVGNSSELAFCFETQECLLFHPICEANGYEVRYYESVKWVSTDEKFFWMDIAVMKAFRRLYKYITGENENGEKIQMTTPVVVKRPKEQGFRMNDYTISFLLPADYQKNAPKPTDPKVYIHDSPDMRVYVKSYGGWMTGMSDNYKAEDLSSVLNSVNAEYEKEFHYAAGYNSPLTIFNRHNEVWFVAKDDPVCPSSEEMD
ncbi:heme-binding protein 2 [Parambassis ranga]|uniref:Heme-binding protein 1 n=1 Tax=Parambassis ranga TaxID=210632 RepID=A0A6P7IW08_9TELE|nr:heme-binding protein 2-like [Parambassis ranga]